MLEIEDRVNHLDELMAQLLKTVDQTSREMREFKEEMREFKEESRQSRERSEQEMRDFKEEMRLAHERAEERSKRETQEFREEMRESHKQFREEMRESHKQFREEMRESHEQFRGEMRETKRDLNKKWGELSNKLGTMAEDLVAPGVPNILKQVTGCTQIKYSAVRVRKSEPRTQEFDVVAVCEEWVLINETKSRLRHKHLDDFVELMQEIREFFPEFAGKKFIGAIASLYVDESLVRYGEKLGLVVLGFGEELMDVLNSPGFVPRMF